jgi:hypothetical protein
LLLNKLGEKMNNKIFFTSAGIFLSIATVLSCAVQAEGLGPESVNRGQTTQIAESGANTVAGVRPLAVQASLTDTLVKQLGITAEQAQGGAGALFQVARSGLDSGQFAVLSKAVPEMDSLLSAASEQSVASSGLAGNASSALGNRSSPYGNLAGLASTFKELKLSPDMVDQFVPIVIDYVQTNGGALTANMLQSVLYGGF